jgi:predicted O-methyltransferase YrrM
VFCDADKQEYPDYLTAALRLLRPGGIAVFDNALWGGRVPDPSYQDEDTTAIREVCERFRSDEQLVPLLLPVGDGLLAGVKRGGSGSVQG